MVGCYLRALLLTCCADNQAFTGSSDMGGFSSSHFLTLRADSVSCGDGRFSAGAASHRWWYGDDRYESSL